MRDAERHALHPKLLRNFRRLTRNRQRRPPARLTHNFQIHPFHPAPPARPQRLHRRLFRRKPPGIPFILVLESLAIFALPYRVDSPQKYFPMALDRSLDAVHLCNVHSHSNDQVPSSGASFGPAVDSDYTVRAVAPTKTLKPERKIRKRTQVGQILLPVSSSPSKSNWIERNVQGIRILQTSAFTKLPWLVHGFSTKPGGVSNQDDEKVLNLGFTEWDTNENVLENRRRF